MNPFIVRLNDGRKGRVNSLVSSSGKKIPVRIVNEYDFIIPGIPGVMKLRSELFVIRQMMDAELKKERADSIELAKYERLKRICKV